MVARVLVGVDGSDGSRRALRWAIGEAAARYGTVQPVMIWQSAYDMGETYVPVEEAKFVEAAREHLMESVAEVAGENPTVEIDPLVLEGDPAQILCERSGEVDLLVVGSRGYGDFAGLLLGSVSSKCAHHSRCPVVIVSKSDQGYRDLGQVGRILVAVDGSEGSRSALRWAIAEAAVRGASVDALSVWHDPYGGDMSLEFEAPYFRRDRFATLEHARELLTLTISEAGRDPAVEIDPLVLQGDPAQILCEHSGDVDLLVVGSRGHGGFSRLMLGSVSSKCAHHSRCPVVIVPKEARTSTRARTMMR